MRLSDSGQFTPPARFQCSRAVALAITLCAVGLIAWVDFELVPNAPVSHLYYLPILFAAVRLGRPAAVSVASLAVAFAHLADPERSQFHYGEADIMELVLFVTVALVASRLAQDARELRRLAGTDDLTGLQNLRAFEAHCGQLLRARRAPGARVVLMCLDVNRLKPLNDTYGHLTGADAVKAVGQIIGANLPSGATACRYGGDEFAIVAIGLTAAQTSAFAVRLQAAVSDVAPVLDSRPFPAGTLSVSVGWAAAERPLEVSAAFTRLFREADAAMYENKRHFHRSLVRTLEHRTS